MSTYREMINENTGCGPEDAVMIEHIMRDEILHYTFDWQTRSPFRRTAFTTTQNPRVRLFGI